jgi:ankyrin repeat protein
MEKELKKNELDVFLKALVLGDINRTYPKRRGKTALHLAARTGKVSCCSTLVEGGADVNPVDDNLFTPLHSAADVDSADVIRYLVKHGADINARTARGASPLIVALAQESMNALNALAELGANLELLDDFGSTALHMAAMEGKLGVVSALVAKGAAFKTSTHDDHCTALHMLALRGKTTGGPGSADYLQMATALIKLGLDPETKLEGGPEATEMDLRLLVLSAHGCTVVYPSSGGGSLEVDVKISPSLDKPPPAFLGAFSPLEIARARGDADMVRLLERAVAARSAPDTSHSSGGTVV